LLEPWRVQCDLEESRRADSIDKDQIDYVYFHLSNTENQLIHCHISLGDYDKATDYCDMALSHARLVITEDARINLIYQTLIRKGQNLGSQSKNNEAKAVFEELYNFIVEIHYPDHPLVLTAANRMIEILITLEEYEDAERYARISYECLTRPTDTESEEVADAAMTLASVTYNLICCGKDGNMAEAEMLARKSLRITQKNHGCDTSSVKIILSNILSKKDGDHDCERKSLLEQCLASYIKAQGVDGIFVARVNNGLAKVHFSMAANLPPGDARIEQMHVAGSYIEEAVRISTKIHGPSHPQTVSFESDLFHMMGCDASI
jgi:tetratricopeptide (TPR) repeat protein